MQYLETIKHIESVLAIIIRSQHHANGIEFYTPNEFSQQIASMGHPKGKTIAPHVHNPVSRSVQLTKEVLIVKTGKLRVDFYSTKQEYLESRVLNQGDVILLVEGGHGFEVLEDIQMIEVKQGPYAGEKDKTRFSPISNENLLIK
jgi:hypothetical protein